MVDTSSLKSSHFILPPQLPFILYHSPELHSLCVMPFIPRVYILPLTLYVKKNDDKIMTSSAEIRQYEYENFLTQGNK